jgi:hypothetical protein
MTVWPFVTLVVAAPAFGAPLARVREMPVRRTYEPALYVTVPHTLSRYFGIVGLRSRSGRWWERSSGLSGLHGRVHSRPPRVGGRRREPGAWCSRTSSSGCS